MQNRMLIPAVLIVAAVLMPLVVHSKPEPEEVESPLSVLEVGQEIDLRQVGSLYEIRINAPFNDAKSKDIIETKPNSRRVETIGKDFVMIRDHDIDDRGNAQQIVEHWIPLTSLRAIIRNAP